MNNNAIISNPTITVVEKTTSWTFGVIILCIGLINTFWGNDTVPGILIALASIGYFVPGRTITAMPPRLGAGGIRVIRIVLAILILWAALGVGELKVKMELMKATLAE